MSDFDLEDRWKSKAEEIAQSIKMQWDAPANNGKILLLVEGEDDRVCYFKLFNHQRVEIRTTEGCNKMKRVFDLIQQYGIPNFAIKDCDFARVCNDVPSEDNFFTTDFHDHEMMCLSEFEVRKAIFFSYAIIFDEALVNEVFEDLEMLSFFKWFNYSSHSNVNFNGYNVRGKEKSDLRSFNAIYETVMPQSPNCVTAITEKDVLDFVNKYHERNYYEITNGHDFISALAKSIEQKYGVKNLKEKDIRLIINAKYSLDFFIKTNLYSDICAWAGEMSSELFAA